MHSEQSTNPSRLTIGLALAAFVLVAVIVAIRLLRAPDDPDASASKSTPESIAPSEDAGRGTAPPDEGKPTPHESSPLDTSPEARTAAAAASLTVVVRVDEEPARGGWVEIWTASPDGRETFGSTAIDDEGIAKFESLEPARNYGVDVEIPPGQVHTRRVHVAGDARVTIRLGVARVYGTVFDNDGDPLPDASVRVLSLAGGVSTGGATDSAGTYTIGALPPGAHQVLASNGTDEIGTRDVELEPGEERRIDFGATPAIAVWSGVVRRSDGTAATHLGERGRRIHLEPADGASAGAKEHRFPYGTDGAFRFPLDAGAYRVTIDSPTCRRRLLIHERFEVYADDVDEDLVIPGATIDGVIRGVDSETAEAMRVQLAPADLSDPSRSPRLTGVRPDGIFGFDGVEPGDWIVTCVGPGEPVERKLFLRQEDRRASVEIDY